MADEPVTPATKRKCPVNETLRVLAIISNPHLLAKIETLLRRRTLEVNHVSSGAGALVLAGNLRFELVIAEHPLPDLRLEELLAAMRALDSVSAHCNFLALSRGGAAALELPAGPDENIRSLAAEAEAGVIHDAISELLGVAARRSARLLVEVQVHLGDEPSRLLYQSQNLSQSGILLRGGRRLKAGSRVRFELALPTGEPIAGRALVVRQTTRQEPVAGTALRFLDLSDDEGARIRSFVHAGLTAQDEPARVAGGEG